ncbi:MAG: homoserine dehydrogenase [Dokdonella sp.]|uniref:homoserine dehydrogenase n=1 Tax=Dokdonella sp. TaxID=2291710 RepID=UPI003263F537
MSAQLKSPASEIGIALVLLGTGGVGSALLRLLATPSAGGVHLVGVANSTRQVLGARGIVPTRVHTALSSASSLRDDAALLASLDASGSRCRVVVDATASALTSARHADWLGRGYHVVSANKSATGSSLDTWSAVRRASEGTGAVYGDAATVGAGLPVLSTLRRLRGCGDRLLTLEGVFSGSLSWLFNQFDGTRPFSALVREARACGYTEPDPRIDLSGADVARKLLILARSAGHPLDVADVDVDGLVPAALRNVDAADFLARIEELDAPLEARRAKAAGQGRLLRFLARLDAHGHARVGLTDVEPTHPAARLGGTDNLFALTTLRYRAQPLVIQGPGAGPEVTAQALLGDVLALQTSAAAQR